MASSASFCSTKDVITVAPPSISNRWMFRLPNSSSRAARLHFPCSSSAMNSSAPLSNMPLCFSYACLVVTISVGYSPHSSSFDPGGILRLLSRTIRSNGLPSQGRGVSSGSSSITVFTPTSIPCTVLRRAWTSFLLASLDIHWPCLALSLYAMYPSSLCAHFRITHGSLVSANLKNHGFNARP